jgi:hypothetical protein
VARTPDEPEPGRMAMSKEDERTERPDCIEVRVPGGFVALPGRVEELPGRPPEVPGAELESAALELITAAALMMASLHPYSMLEMPPTRG